MQAIFIDLEGTLCDPSEGIFAAITAALEDQGEDVPSRAEMGWMVGPPIWSVFETILGPSSDVGAAVTKFYEVFLEDGVESAEIYDGIGEMLADLQDLNASLYIISAMPTQVAIRMAEALGLDSWCERVFGSEISGENSDKTSLIAASLNEMGHDPARCIVLGDRSHDIEGARNNDIPSIGAMWGFADDGELHMVEADGLAGAPEDVIEITADLLGLEL